MSKKFIENRQLYVDYLDILYSASPVDEDTDGSMPAEALIHHQGKEETV